MRITLRTEGGIAHFPGLARPRVLDTAALSESDARAIEALVDAAQFFTRPDAAPPSPVGADRRKYTLTVERAEESRTLHAYDPLDPALSALVAKLRKPTTSAQ
jgi:hypothetical protein